MSAGSGRTTTFQVDAVEPASVRLPTLPLGSRCCEALAIGGDPATEIIDHGDTHALLGAVGLAFAQHRPLVLSPDAVWLTIAQGVAQHVRLHAETLRPRLVKHDGRKRLTIPVSGTPATPAAWSAAISAFRDKLADEIGDGRARLFACDFSTSTEVERIASQIVLLDAYSKYFSLWMTAVCGIPSITLTGTVSDWRRIRERIDVIAELDLALWCRSLAPITDQFVRAAAGDVDVAFWQRIYNPVDAYGGDVITGWITRLYPYLEPGGAVKLPNPMLELSIDEPRNLTSSTQRGYSGPGLRSDEVPNTSSRVTVHVVDSIAGELGSVALSAGVTAVVQTDDGALCPIAGWHLEPASVEIAEVLDRITREHRTVPAPPAGDHMRCLEGPPDVVAMFSHLEAATLFEGDRAWQILPPRAHLAVSIEGVSGWSIRTIADLPDGRSICYAVSWQTQALHWLVCRVHRDEPPAPDALDVLPRTATATESPEEIRLLGTSLAALLDAGLVADGEIDHLETGRFWQLLPL